MKPQVSIKKKIYYLKQHSRFAYKSYINCKLWGQYTIFFLSYFSFKTAIKTVTYAKYFINCKNCSIFFSKKKKNEESVAAPQWVRKRYRDRQSNRHWIGDLKVKDNQREEAAEARQKGFFGHGLCWSKL